MKKIVILFITTMIISVCLLNGCTQQDKNSNNTSNSLDSDDDGYPDNQDDFPTISDIHEKITIISGSEIFEENQGIGAFFDVDSDCKFVVVNWEVTNPKNLSVDEQQNIIFELMYPPNNFIDYSYNIVNNRNLQFTINSSSLGKWNYGFMNSGVTPNVTIFREIYLVK